MAHTPAPQRHNNQSHAREGVALVATDELAPNVTVSHMAKILIAATLLGGSMGGVINWIGPGKVLESITALNADTNVIVQIVSCLGLAGLALWPMVVAVISNLVRHFTGGQVWIKGYILSHKYAVRIGIAGTFASIVIMLFQVDFTIGLTGIRSVFVTNMAHALISSVVGIVLEIVAEAGLDAHLEQEE